MSVIQDAKADLETVVPIIKKPLEWASHKMWKRLFVYAVVLLAFSVGLIWYVNNLVDESSKVSDKHEMNRSELSDKNTIQAAIDLANMCLKSIEVKSSNSEWYCDVATKKYQNIQKGKSEKHVQKVITSQAYEYMVVDLSRELRNVDYSKLVNNQPNPLLDRLKLMTSNVGLIAYGIIIFLITFVLIFVFKKIIESRANNQD